MGVTIKDIAKELNISHTTVSRALNDSPLISRDTIKKVKKVAEKLNYRPNVNARSLVLSKSYNIGLFFSSLTSGTTPGFFLDVVKGVTQAIQNKYRLMVDSLDIVTDYHLVNKRNFDGIVLMSQSVADDRFLEYVQKENIPIVVLNRETDFKEIDTVLADDQIGAFKATEYLIKKGHTRIAHITGKKGFKSSQRREQGYFEALKANNLQPDYSLVKAGKYDIPSGHETMKELLKQGTQPTAVFCANDEMAVGALKAIREAGLEVPKDISIVGFDDIDYAEYLSPALTTIRRPIEQISYEGTQLLLGKLENDEHPTDVALHLVKTHLVERESVQSIG